MSSMTKNNSNHLTNEQCKQLVEQIDFDKLFDNLLIEYQKRNKSKKLELVRKGK